MKKLYLDIECNYSGKIGKKEKWKFYDYENWKLKDGGIIGILGIGIAKNQKKELIFKQFLIDKNDTIEIKSQQKRELLGLISRADLIVTFNGRNFDIPIIAENFGIDDTEKSTLLSQMSKKDRDLFDIYMLKSMNIRGGLKSVIKKLGIDYNMGDEIDIEMCCRRLFEYGFSDDDIDKELKKDLLKSVLSKNENDIRVLPLLEESLGLFWRGREDIDIHHKLFDSFYDALDKEKDETDIQIAETIKFIETDSIGE